MLLDFPVSDRSTGLKVSNFIHSLRVEKGRNIMLEIATSLLVFLATSQNRGTDQPAPKTVAKQEIAITAPATTSLSKSQLEVKQKVTTYFADIPLMSQIAGCESHYNQFDKDGSIYRGEINNADVGVMQINEYYHLEASKKLGYDIHTLDGNMAYARYLYEREGSEPWSSSAYCWKKSDTLSANKSQLALAKKQ